MKKLLSCLLALSLLVTLLTPAFAAPAQTVNVKVNGETVQWTDATPFIDENGRTLVPLRPVAEAMGVQVEWRGDTQTAVFSQERVYATYKEVESVHFKVGESTARFYGNTVISASYDDPYEFTFTMDTKTVLKDGRTYAPLRYLAEAFGFEVSWDQATFTASADYTDVTLFWIDLGGSDGLLFAAAYIPAENYGDYYGMEISDVKVNGQTAEFYVLTEAELAEFNADFGANYVVFCFGIVGDYAPGDYVITWTERYYEADGTLEAEGDFCTHTVEDYTG